MADNNFSYAPETDEATPAPKAVTPPVTPSAAPAGAAAQPAPKAQKPQPDRKAQKAPKKEEAENEELTFNFRFFKSSAQSLKRFSLVLFILNLFFIVTGTAVGAVYLAVLLGGQLMAMLAMPIVLVVAVLILLARFVSAVVYGFGEVVERAERENAKAAEQAAAQAPKQN